ncbi:MAG: hypothetical protein U0Q12_17925 [Vicinamibacterales bacterium]|mgnify:CR=1 FL=1
MTPDAGVRQRTRFRRDALCGRAKTRLLTGIALLALSVGYGGWAMSRLARRGAERGVFDGAIVGVARTLVRSPDVPPTFTPSNDNELFLLAVITDQQDTMFGLTVLVLRGMVAGTAAGLGMVLLTSGSTEWEVRSELASPVPASRL